MGLQQQFLVIKMALGLPAENVTGGWLLQVLLKRGATHDTKSYIKGLVHHTTNLDCAGLDVPAPGQ